MDGAEMNLFLYLAVVLIWGTTWIAIAQQGTIDPPVAVFWRFLIASACIFVFLFVRKKLIKLDVKDHFFCVLQGACVFGFNFFCIYHAVTYINSGLESVIFSMAVLFNTINSYLFFKQKIPLKFYFATLLGFLGMLALFWHDLIGTAFKPETLKGIGLCMLGTYGFSLGNMVSIRHQKNKLDILNTNAYAMFYGTLIMGSLAWVQHYNFLPHLTLGNQIAILYLAIIGSVVGFTAYFSLIGRIGAGKSAYSTLLFPLVALTISTFFEGYVWSISAVIGVVLILCGNAVFFIKKRA